MLQASGRHTPIFFRNGIAPGRAPLGLYPEHQPEPEEGHLKAAAVRVRLNLMAPCRVRLLRAAMMSRAMKQHTE